MATTATATATARAVILSRITALSSKPLPPSLFPFLPTRRNRPSSAVTLSCLKGGGVYDDDYFVSTQKSKLDRGFLVIANMLKNIEPLDTCVISKGVSDSAKESMKRTISTMLGILPSDQFSVLVSLSKPPLHRLLFSSIITGYTLWNAEYRVSLMRNLERAAPVEEVAEEATRQQRQREVVEEKREYSESPSGFEELDKIRPRVFGDLSPEALKYIENLQAELSDAEEELNAQKKANVQIECDRENRNDLLEYLRSLDANMVTELSQPSSVQVEEIIHQLVQNIFQKFFKDELNPDFMGDPGIVNTENHQEAAEENCGTVGTSRDYLAKLLFWCMLLGHHLRGLENRLHLSCVVGLL